MKNFYIILNIVALLLMIPAINFAIAYLLFYPAVLDFLQSDFWFGFFALLSGFLIVIIPVGMILAFSYRWSNYPRLSIWILVVTLFIVGVAIIGFHLTTKSYTPLYRWFIPEWLFELVVPGYRLM